MAKAKKSKSRTTARRLVYDATMMAVLRHAHNGVAGSIYPLPGDADKSKWRNAIKKLIDMGLLSDKGKEPNLTVRGHNVCRAFAARDWRWP